MVGLDLLAQGVEFFGDGAYARFESLGGSGEGEGIETQIRITKIITNAEPSSRSQAPK